MSMIKSRLREFKLSGIHNSYEERAKYALDKSLSYEEFLELLLEDEANKRADNGFKKRYSKAKFPYSKNIEDFDFAFQPSIDKRVISDICTSSFVKEKRNAANLTQPELAQKAGVGLRFIRDLEQGKETLRLDKVNQVLQLFGFQVGAVLTEREADEKG